MGITLRLAVIVLAVLFSGPANARGEIAAGGKFVWTISGSDQDPFLLWEPPFLGESTVYLWMACDVSGGYGAIEADMDFSGTLEVLSFTTLNGTSNSGTLPNVHLTFPSCQNGFLAGSLTVRDSTGAGGTLCLSGANVTRDCGGLGGVYRPNFYFGYATPGPIQCSLGNCGIDYAMPGTWGRVKAEFRR